mgnify:CR=1 FL=1
MNKKLTVMNKFGESVYCILSDCEALETQMMEVLNLKPGQGFSVSFLKEFVEVNDYYSNETVGSFQILSFVDTDETVDLNWKKSEQKMP